MSSSLVPQFCLSGKFETKWYNVARPSSSLLLVGQVQEMTGRTALLRTLVEMDEGGLDQ